MTIVEDEDVAQEADGARGCGTFGYVPKFMARDFPETTYLTGQDN